LASTETEERSSGLRTDAKLASITDALRHDIVFGRLKPRERLVEEELSERFSVGRHVVRAALEELDRMGLVRRRQNRGAVVSDYSPEEVDELYEIRAILQREAARRITLPASPAFIAKLTAVNADYVRFGKAGDLDSASIANDQFHQLIFNKCNNRHLAELIQRYWLKTAAIHCYAIASPSLAEKSREEHLSIIEAMRLGDRERFEAMCIEHMKPALSAFKAAHGGWILRA
jgi:DNA-binding GntR family transcriptional regulator